jgi:hypothetical protein
MFKQMLEPLDIKIQIQTAPPLLMGKSDPILQKRGLDLIEREPSEADLQGYKNFKR